MPTTSQKSPARGKPSRATSSSGRKKLAIGVLVFAFLGAAIWYFDVALLLKRATAWVDDLGVWGPVIFIGVYVLATVVFIPGSALTLAAGGLFGVGLGAVYVSIASTIGATLAFLLGRHLMRGFVSSKIEGNEKFAAVDEAVAEQGWKIVGLTRLSPAFPFALLNYAYGLTKVSLRDYVLASWMGMMPGTVLYVYLGAVGKAAADSQGRTVSERILLGVGFIATAVVTVYVTRIARRALNSRLESKAAGEAAAIDSSVR